MATMIKNSNTNTKEERALLRQAKREENQRLKTERREIRLQAKLASRQPEPVPTPAPVAVVAPTVAPAVTVPAATTTTTDKATLRRMRRLAEVPVTAPVIDTTTTNTTTTADKATLRRMRRTVLRQCSDIVCEPILSAMELEAGLKQVVRMKRRQVKDIRRTCRLLRQTSEALSTEQADLERLTEAWERQTAKVGELVQAAFSATTTPLTQEEPVDRERRRKEKKEQQQQRMPKALRVRKGKEGTTATCVDCTVCLMANEAAVISRRNRRRECC